MTERKKWCDLCKCSISNNPATIKNHDLGPRHKDNVAKMSNTREEKVAKDKEKKESVRVLTLAQIEEKASRSYQNNLSTFQKAKDSNATTLGSQRSKTLGDLSSMFDSNAIPLGAQTSEELGDISTMFELSGDWQRDMSLGYYYNQTNGCYYDPNSGFYYTDALGKWVTLKEVLAATPKLSSPPIQKKSLTSKTQTESKTIGRHPKDNVTKRPSNIREEKVAKDKEKKKKKKGRVVTQVEEKERLSYQNDTSTFHKATDSNATSSSAQTNSEGIDDDSTMFGDWEHDMSSGYYYNLSNGCFYDPNSGLFYTHDLGKWVTLKEALAATSKPPSVPVQKKHNIATSPLTSKSQTKSKTQPSKHDINKRKRKPKVVSEEEAAALKAREVERKRVEEREKSGILPIRFTYSRRRKD